MSTAEINAHYTAHEAVDKEPRPRTSEGVFYSGLVEPEAFYGRPLGEHGMPVYDTEVSKRHGTNITTVHSGIGKTRVESWEMSDGTRYDILIGNARRNDTGMLVFKDTAWTTQPQGFNEDVARMLMSSGFDVVIKGPEIGTSIELAHSAHNSHVVLDKMSDLGISDTDMIALEGYSRGAMIGFGTLARARLHDRKVLYANLTDACMAEPAAFNSDTLGEMLKGAPAELATVAVELGMLALNPRKLWHYRKTFDASGGGATQMVRTGLPLFTGEAGILAGQIPEDTEATAAFFKNSFANHREVFRKIIKGEDGSLRPGIEVKLALGGHGRGMSKKILGNIGLRFTRLAEELRAGAGPNEIDFTRIHRPADS